MEDSIFIQHRFKVEQDGLVLQDAIVLPQEEYDKLSDTDIEQIKQERFDNFKEVVSNPTPEPEIPPEVVLEQINDQIQAAQDQIDSLTQQAEVVQAQIDSPETVEPVEEVK